MTRRIALVSGHFAPSNLVGAHRARLWSRYLPEFGWQPVVVTGDPAQYEERPDPDLERLVPAGLEVVHAATFPTKPLRLVGDIGVRAFWGCYRALSEMAKAGRLDFVLVTIPSNFLAPLGRLLHRRYGVPFGIDYQDPWVNRWPGIDVPLSRAWASYRLAGLLEPWSVRDAALITGMAEGYVAGMLERNPDVARRSTLAYMPMGSAPEDYALVRDLRRQPFLFRPGDGHFHLIYAGALLPAGMVVLDAFLAGLRELRARSPGIAAKLCVHFVGTGSSPDDPQGYRVLPRAEAAGVADLVSEHPHRIGYVDTLSHLIRSDAILVLGSTERHYTPSKVFQAILSERPVFAMLHEASTAVSMIRDAGAGEVLTLTEEALPTPQAVASALRLLVEQPVTVAGSASRLAFDAYSARESTRLLADALDRAVGVKAAR
ncbi:MAG: hypothetical protein IKE60_26615 [Reyranella sp.]|uniref:hypothetical protein n=1 Tax=Reyranella sp. TaxID=1929291 RepID=UPI0025FA0A89|nr:hypothetical protein [Reyranella sp.]MBR2818264.1 hypothetical protein [Reyranella sp.]